MNIGFVKQERKNFKQQDGSIKEVKWLECYFRIAGIRPFNAKMQKNKRKESDNHPDFHIYLRSNINKGDKFRDIRIGALWIKEKEIDGVPTKFMTGNLFVGMEEVSIGVWNARPRYEGDEVHYLYDISLMREREDREESGSGYEVTYEDAQPAATAADAGTPPQIDIDEDEIPF